MLPGLIGLTGFISSVAVGSIHYFTAESLGNQSKTNASGTFTLLSSAQTLAPGNYVVFWSADMACSPGAGVFASLTPTVDGATIETTQQLETSDGADVFSFGGMHFFTADGASHTFGIQGIVDSGGTDTGIFKNTRISALFLGANDAKQATLTAFNRSVTSLATAVTMTFTPPSNGNYILIACFQVETPLGGTPELQLSDGTTTIDYSLWDTVASHGSMPYLWMIPITGVAGVAKTVTLKLATQPSGATVLVRNMRLLALREDRFANVYKARLAAGDNSGTQTVFTSALAQTFTPAAADHLTLAGVIVGCSSDTARDAWQYNDGGTIVASNQRLPQFCQTDTPPVVQGALIAARIANYAASSRTQEIDRKAVDASTAYVKQGSMIATLDLTGI